jgi:D-3-phosphoglycerate dehydrogenase
MKILIVGDFYIPATLCRTEIRQLEEHFPDAKITVLEWNTSTLEDLEQKNRRVEQFGPTAEPFPPEILREIVDADLLLVHFCPVPAALINKAAKLRIIGCMRAGLENIDVDAAQKRGVKVINNPGRNAEAVAEFTVGLMLTESRNIARSHAALKQGIWRKNYPNSSFSWEMEGRTAGLIGFGEIGKKVAYKLQGFNMQILAYDPYIFPAEIARCGGRSVELRELLQHADIVSIHTRLSHETKNLIGQNEISLMKPTAYLINTARAGIVDYQALYEALRNNTIAGAALDVFPEEPLPLTQPLLEMDNVTITSHMAGSTVDACHKSVRMLAIRICKELDKVI